MLHLLADEIRSCGVGQQCLLREGCARKAVAEEGRRGVGTVGEDPAEVWGQAGAPPGAPAAPERRREVSLWALPLGHLPPLGAGA